MISRKPKNTVPLNIYGGVLQGVMLYEEGGGHDYKGCIMQRYQKQISTI